MSRSQPRTEPTQAALETQQQARQARPELSPTLRHTQNRVTELIRRVGGGEACKPEATITPGPERSAQ